MATSAVAAKPAVQPAAAAPKKKSNLLLIAVLVVVLLTAGAGAAWWFMHSAEDGEEDAVESKPSIFLPLEQFTVNLQPEEGQQQFLQLAMTVKVADQDVAEGIKAQMPQVRSRVLFLLSSKKPSEVGSAEGKNKLIEQLIQELEAVLPAVKSKAKKRKAGDEDDFKAKKAKNKKKAKEEAVEEEAAPARVLAVYFTHFIVQ